MSRDVHLLLFASTFTDIFSLPLGYYKWTWNIGGISNFEADQCIFLRYSQGKKKRQHGTEAVKSHIVAAKTVANIVKTSLVRVPDFIEIHGL